MPTIHVPVQLNDVLSTLDKAWGTDWNGRSVVDGTFGGGGYTEAFLKRGATVHGFDMDAKALQRRRDLQAAHGEKLKLHHANFAELSEYIQIPQDAIVLDLGISSDQLDTPERGLSYQADGFLDMRLNQSTHTTAADLLNTASEEALIHIFRAYGEEPRARKLAQTILQQRQETPFETTHQLLATIEQVYPYKEKRGHPANRIFQALRIAVNGELDALEAFLPQGRDALKPKGLLGIVTFHSLEDRLVKRFMQAQCQPSQDVFGRHMADAAFRTHKVKVSAQEAEENPRGRSAILRVLQRVS